MSSTCYKRVRLTRSFWCVPNQHKQSPFQILRFHHPACSLEKNVRRLLTLLIPRSFNSPEPRRRISTSVSDHPAAHILPRVPSLRGFLLLLKGKTENQSSDDADWDHELRALRKQQGTLGFLWKCGCVCMWVCMCLSCDWWSGGSFCSGALKATLGVLCWYIRRGRKGGSRIIQWNAAALHWRGRIEFAYECISEW